MMIFRVGSCCMILLLMFPLMAAPGPDRAKRVAVSIGSVSILNKTYFRGSMTFADEEGGGVTGSTASVARCHVKRLAAGELTYTNISADVIPLGHIENRRGVKIPGLFGMSLLKNVEIVIDVSLNELQVFKLDKNGSRSGNSAPPAKYDIIQKTEVFHNVMFVKAIIGGKVLDFCLDTGPNRMWLALMRIKKQPGCHVAEI